MNQIELSNNDKVLMIGFVIAQTIGLLMQEHLMVILAYAGLGLMLASKFYTALADIRLSVVKLQQQEAIKIEKIRPTPVDITNGLSYNVESIPRLLGSIKLESGITVFDHIVENSTPESASLNLVKAHNLILESLQQLKVY